MGFWHEHGIFLGLLFLLGLALLPRLTLLIWAVFVAGIVSGFAGALGVHGYLAFGVAAVGWVIWWYRPALLTALLATIIYWHTNAVLCILAWVVMFWRRQMLKYYLKHRQERAARRAQSAAQDEFASAFADGVGGLFRSRLTPWWEVLEVSPNASLDVIKSAYRTLAKKTHPDATGNPDDASAFRRVREAYLQGKRQHEQDRG